MNSDEKTIWYPNGFIVQDVNDDLFKKISSEKYSGIGRYESWPLQFRKREGSAGSLTQEAWDKWLGHYFETDDDDQIYPPWVIPDMSFIKRYVHECDSLGIKIRVLFCKSDFDFPLVDDELLKTIEDKLQMMGFEYYLGGDFYAAVPDDLYGVIPDEFREFKDMVNRLNEYGLFSTEKDLSEYIKFRNLAIEKYPGDFETGDDFAPEAAVDSAGDQAGACGG